jgi:hypothetical protein
MISRTCETDFVAYFVRTRIGEMQFNNGVGTFYGDDTGS